MSDEFSIDRNRRSQAGDAPLRGGASNPGALEWDIAEAADDRGEPQAAAATGEARPAEPSPATPDHAAAMPLPFKDLLDDDEEQSRSTLPVDSE